MVVVAVEPLATAVGVASQQLAPAVLMAPEQTAAEAHLVYLIDKLRGLNVLEETIQGITNKPMHKSTSKKESGSHEVHQAV